MGNLHKVLWMDKITNIVANDINLVHRKTWMEGRVGGTEVKGEWGRGVTSKETH